MLDGEEQEVSIHFTLDILFDIFDYFGDNLKIRRIDENTLAAVVTVQVSKTLFSWVVGTQG